MKFIPYNGMHDRICGRGISAYELHTHTYTLAVHLTILSASRVSPLDKEIALIALPTLATLAADPIASLVDTAYIGHLGEPCHL
jgi:hypothetical protein